MLLDNQPEVHNTDDEASKFVLKFGDIRRNRRARKLIENGPEY